MNEKRFIAILWTAKAALFAILLYAGFGVVAGRLHLGAMFDPGTASGEQQATDGQLAVRQESPPSDYTAIVQRNLFAGANNVDSSRAASNRSGALDSTASAEELGWRLVGTIAGGPAASRAILQNTKSNATGSYRIGDTIASPASGTAGATVEIIQRDAVVLRYRGQDLTLKLRAGTTADHPPKTAGAPGQEDPRQAGPPGVEASASTKTQTAPLPRGRSVAEVFRQATLEPYVKDHRTEGLRITGLENIPMAELLGLRNGDIVRSVNGQQLTSKQKAFQVLMKAKTQSKVDLQLLRDGANKNLSFDL
jgi:general secretion pathway protein C